MWKAPVLSPSPTLSHKSMALLTGFPNLSIDQAVDAVTCVELLVSSAVSGWMGVGQWVVGSGSCPCYCKTWAIKKDVCCIISNDGNWYHLPTESMEFVMKKYWFRSRHCSHFLSKTMSRAMNSVAVDTIAACATYNDIYRWPRTIEYVLHTMKMSIAENWWRSQQTPWNPWICAYATL